MSTNTTHEQLSDVIATLNRHVSIREYTDRPLDDDTLLTLLEAARRAPTSANMQAYSFVVVRDPELKQQLAVLGGEQRHIETCAAFIAVCADLSNVLRACELHERELDPTTENTIVTTVDASLAGMSLALAAESIGLGTVMIGGMRNHPAAVAELLNLPHGAYVVFGLCIGWPAEAQPQKPRMAPEAIIHFEQYDATKQDALLAEYDKQLAEHYREQGRKTPDAAWTQVIAQKLSVHRRADLRPVLEARGLHFE